nr:hypothetical protein [Tanacetum cinerariifolium]
MEIVGISSLMKCTFAIRQMAYGAVPDSLDEYLQMGATTARDSLRNFCKVIMNLYGKEFLRKPTYTDMEKLYAHHDEKHWIMTLHDESLIDYGKYALWCMTRAYMKKIVHLKSVRDELLRIMEEKRQLKKQSLIFKVDFEKAYDSVRWDFLDDVLKKLVLEISGTKVGGNMSRVQAWTEVFDKVKSRLSNWKIKSLSIG